MRPLLLLLFAAELWAAVAMGGKVTFVPPCLFVLIIPNEIYRAA